jgi:hypothetical protein
LPPILSRLDHLLGLEKDWDSYGAAPIEPDTARSALGILSQVMSRQREVPFIAPLNDGGLQIEWTRGDIEVGFITRAFQAPVGFTVSHDEDEDWFLDRSDGFARLLRSLGAFDPAP